MDKVKKIDAALNFVRDNNTMIGGLLTALGVADSYWYREAMNDAIAIIKGEQRQ